LVEAACQFQECTSVKSTDKLRKTANKHRHKPKPSAVGRRAFLQAASLAPALFSLVPRSARAAVGGIPKPTDIQVDEVSIDYEEFPYRTPFKFGGRQIDGVTVLNVHCAVHTVSGRSARGFGSMPLVSAWAFSSVKLSFDATLAAMKELATRIQAAVEDYGGPAHPMDISTELEPEYLGAARDVAEDLGLGERIPKLCTLVTASAFDAALHDAFGKAQGLPTYQTYGRDFMTCDLGHYLGPEFNGEHPDQYVLRDPKPRLAVYHAVGETDPLEEADVKERIHDGLPMSLRGWINYNGLTHIKIKLAGNNMEWDLERMLSIDRTASSAQAARGVKDWVYSLDFNEQCRHVGYLVDFLRRLKEKSPSAYERIQFLEQPTRRDLENDRENVMFEVAKLKPVVIDESLTGLDRLKLARQMGYSGAALKTCKGHTQSVLLAAYCQKKKMFLCVMDLTCPGASLVHSVGLAAHLPTVTAVESNARHFVPAGNQGWASKFPGIFVVEDGDFRTGDLTKPGLGVVA
jgi:L-alanine-DL-glutamate epimerase-like enolase superfamily enzyme